MTLQMDKQADSASHDGKSTPAQLPAYSETDTNSNAGFEMVDAPQSPSQPTYMTAEQEKAYLADRERLEAPQGPQPNIPFHQSENWKDRHHISPPMLLETDEQPSGGNSSTRFLSRGLQVPSCRRRVSSGFPYPDVLSKYGITPQEWSSFTSEITQAAKLSSKDWSISVGAGAATFAASGIFIGWLGVIPAILVGHHVCISAENKKLQAARDTGDLETKLLRWNQTSFAPKGFLVRLDLPGEESGDLDRMDVYTQKKRGSRCCGSRRANAEPFNKRSCCTQKAEKRAEKRTECSKRKMAARKRIVIVPLDKVHESMTESSAKDINALSASEKGLYVGPVSEI